MKLIIKYKKKKSEKINCLQKRVVREEEKMGNKLLWKLFIKYNEEQDE